MDIRCSSERDCHNLRYHAHTRAWLLQLRFRTFHVHQSKTHVARPCCPPAMKVPPLHHHRRAARERKKPPAYPVCFAEVSARNTESSSLISRCDGYPALCKDSNNGLPAEKHWATLSTCGTAACMYACVGCPGSVETRICVRHCAVMFNPSHDTRGENFVHASRRRRLLVAFKPVLKPLGITRTEASIAEIAMNMHTHAVHE